MATEFTAEFKGTNQDESPVPNQFRYPTMISELKADIIPCIEGCLIEATAKQSRRPNHWMTGC